MSRRYAPIRWIEPQVDRLDRAVQAYNDAIEEAQERYKGTGLAFLLPPKTDVASEIDRIDTASQLNMRVASLQRIMRPGALDIDLAHQMTNYEYHEGIVAKSVVNRWRLQRLHELGGEVRVRNGKYEPANTYTRRLINETYLMPNEQTVAPENVHHLQRMALQYSGGNISALRTYFANYLAEWKHNYKWAPQYDEVKKIINELMEQPVALINKVFYDYDEYGTFDYLYPGIDRTYIEKKAQNILDYWRDMRKKWWADNE